MLKRLGKYRGLISHALIGEFSPSIFKGMLLELLNKGEFTVEVVVKYVENNTCFWDMLGVEWQEKLRAYAPHIGSLDWLTDVWVIGAIRGEKPQLASLFLGWKKARNWLKRQLEIIKKQLFLEK